MFEQASCSSVGDGTGKGLSAAESNRALRRPLDHIFLASIWHDDDGVSASLCILAMFEICDRLRFYEIVN